MFIDFSQPFWQKKYILIDSRKLTAPSDTLFFALKGQKTDGHAFIEKLYSEGVRNFVVSNTFYQPNTSASYPQATFMGVDSVLRTFQDFVAYHRGKFTFPVIGITGSNGKTIVKEWLYQLLSDSYNIVKSPKSFNSQVGVPLSVWEMRTWHNLAIFEAGISKTDEMYYLERIIQPTIGIFTNIGSAHDEGFRTMQQKADEKALLFAHAELVIYAAQYEAISKAMTNTAAKKLVWQIKSRSETQVEIEIRCFEKQKNTTYLLSLNIPFTDTASTENAIHCAVLLWHLGYDLPSINQKISQLQNIQMRLELKEGINDCLLIDDSYNNDLAGLKIALDFVEQQTTDKPRTVILSDMLQIGNDTQTLYREIADLLESKKISRLIGIGEDMQRYAAFFENKNINAQFFATTADFVESRLVFQQELILVKGARKFAFEQIIQLLQRKLHGTRLEINLEALSYNLNMYKSLLKPSTRVMVMVKSFAYGSGSYEVASLLQYHQVDYLAVAYTDEAVFLRQKGIRVPIMVMNLSVESLSVFLQYPSIEPVVYSESMLHQVAAFAEKKRTKIAVHLEIDTGMHRLGFAPDNLVLQLLTKYKTVLEVKSIFTHLAAADEPKHTDFTRQQLDVFVEFAQKVEQCLAYRIIKHALNSPGITAFPEYQMDMVRLGIGLYGIDVNHKLRLQPISTLKTTISQIKIVPATDTIGYGRHGKLRQDTPIGIIAIGYGDGYDRRFSRGIGKVMINNKLAPVIGNVCMDMTMIDLSGIEAKEGDEVTIFGENPTISTLAEAIGTISYEILTGISERVKRVFYAG